MREPELLITHVFNPRGASLLSAHLLPLITLASIPMFRDRPIESLVPLSVRRDRTSLGRGRFGDGNNATDVRAEVISEMSGLEIVVEQSKWAHFGSYAARSYPVHPARSRIKPTSNFPKKSRKEEEEGRKGGGRKSGRKLLGHLESSVSKWEGIRYIGLNCSLVSKIAWRKLCQHFSNSSKEKNGLFEE